MVTCHQVWCWKTILVKKGFYKTVTISFSVSQGTGQGRILSPFMYKVFINSLLNEFSEHNYVFFINT